MSFIYLLFLFGATIGSALLIYMYMEAHRDNIKHIKLTFNEFPSSFGEVKIFFISDIHKRLVSQKIIDSLKGKADLVIIGGDLTEKRVPMTRVAENLNRLKEIGHLYFVWGNNDYEVDYHELDSLLLNCGVKILDNTSVSFDSPTGEKIILVGVDDMNSKRDRLELAYSDCLHNGFRILVSHDPRIMSKVKSEYNINLVLSGHTHGGQIRLGRIGLYEKGGITTFNKTQLLVSNGYGTTALPLRLGAKAETHFITISSRNS
jgi:uncharacterized protein